MPALLLGAPLIGVLGMLTSFGPSCGAIGPTLSFPDACSDMDDSSVSQPAPSTYRGAFLSRPPTYHEGSTTHPDRVGRLWTARRSGNNAPGRRRTGRPQHAAAGPSSSGPSTSAPGTRTALGRAGDMSRHAAAEP